MLQARASQHTVGIFTLSIPFDSSAQSVIQISSFLRPPVPFTQSLSNIGDPFHKLHCLSIRINPLNLIVSRVRRGRDYVVDKHSAAMLPMIVMISKELVAASTVPLVLSVLAEGESYGYALIQRVRELSEGQIQWSEGMLYPVLHWMEAQEFIVSEWRAGESGRRRKYYRLRQRGQKALNTEKQQ